MMVDNIINQEDGDDDGDDDDGDHNTCINCLSSMMTAAWFQSTTWNQNLDLDFVNNMKSKMLFRENLFQNLFETFL